MRSILRGALQLLSPGSWRDRGNVAALAKKLGVSRSDAEWIYARSRRDGFGAAMQAYEIHCRERAGVEATATGP